MKDEKFKRYQTFRFKHPVSKQWLSAFCSFPFPFFITRFLAACKPKTIPCLAGGLPTDGLADLRMNTFAACRFEIKTIKGSAPKLDHGGRSSAVGEGSVRGRFIRSSALPSAGITKRSHFAALRLKQFDVLDHSVAQAIWCLGRFDDGGSWMNHGRTLPNREVISRQFLRIHGQSVEWTYAC